MTSLVIQTSKFAPLLFLFAIQEIRENKGFINKLDVTNGYVSGWILMSVMYTKWVSRYYKNIRKILQNNEVAQFWPHLITLLALITFTLIYRFGKFESAIAIVFGSVIYLFIISGLEKNIRKEKARFILSLASFLGSLSLLVLLA